MDTIVYDSVKYRLSVLQDDDPEKGMYVADSNLKPYLVVQVMNDQEEPYMMIRALDGSRLRLVNQPDYSHFFKMLSD